ncbi:MAG: family 65 glycosyl hydrolase [Bacteroidetes bacterium]|nr:MAG: family 65 glycosyl hydrolase [Bacteroidota bacterium]
MKPYYELDPWCIVEKGFDPSMQEASESIFSLGNGRMGQRANFEEAYSGESLQGNYLAGVYYPDKTRVGWWKNGYPEYFAKVLNAPNWVGIDVEIGGETLDLHRCEVFDFKRVLNMREGFLERSFGVKIAGGLFELKAKRFLSIDREEIGAIRYAIRAVDCSAQVVLRPYIDGNVMNRDTNYDERFWEMISTAAAKGKGRLMARTRKSNFVCCMTMAYALEKAAGLLSPEVETIERDDYVANVLRTAIEPGTELVFYKYVSVLSSLNYEETRMPEDGEALLGKAMEEGFDALFEAHRSLWEEKWKHSDIVIEGDVAAQQAIRFNIFQLNQTYTGRDERLNIGPKGFTGEKYGGSTYWDTEAYMLPFYLSTAPEEVSRKLLVYRYRHLKKAIENAGKLGFGQGAALYPMVTMNGEECHNEWEITFEEIHRNGAIAFAIYNYIRYTGDNSYLAEYGLEVLIGISRFWRQRVNWSEARQAFVMLGVTGPNEYENNVNNNWYTNTMARWTLVYTIQALEFVEDDDPDAYSRILRSCSFDPGEEKAAWQEIIAKLYFPYDEKLEVFMQQDGFMDKEQRMAADLDPAERPINQHWSWDRILRSCFIKQADVLQGIYLFEEDFDTATIQRNFDFYEPRTVHESSLSPCVHSILASRLGMNDKAYEMYLRTSRLDIDDYNNEVAEGLHITSMGGTWMSVIQGFGGMRIREGRLSFDPHLPTQWKGLSFTVLFRGRSVKVSIWPKRVEVELLGGEALELFLGAKLTALKDRVVFEL